MLRHLLSGLTDRRLDRTGTVRDDTALPALVSVLAHGDRPIAADALGRALWAAALAGGALAAVLAVGLALSAGLAVLPAHPALLVVGVAAGFALVASVPFAVAWAVRRLLAGAVRRL